MTEDLTKQLLDLPEKIKVQQKTITDDAFKLEQKRLEVTKIETEIAGIVANDVSLTNDTKRRAKIKELLVQSERFTILAPEVLVMEKAQRLAQIELDYLHNLFKAYLAIAGMGK